MQITNSLFNKLTHDTIILTPNRRLSAVLHQLFEQHQLQLGLTVWKTPTILPISTWLQQLWFQHTQSHFVDFPLLLNSQQELYLWEAVLGATKDANQLLQIGETAELAKSAYGLLQQWQVDLQQPIFQSSDDYRALLTWIDAYQYSCKTQNVIDSNACISQIIHAIESKKIPLPEKIILIGFNELSPQIKTLLAYCKQVETTSLNTTPESCHRLTLVDFEDEIITMARWVKTTLKTNPTATIGCVIPSLDNTRDRVEQLFLQVMGSDNIPFNISAGKPLIAYPVLNAALQLLSIQQPTLSSENLNFLLSTPFMGEAELERIPRAKFDAYLRKNNVMQLKVLEPAHPIEKHCSFLHKRLLRYFELFTKQESKQTYAEWANLFNELLTTLGWPGERSLNSAEYQVVDAWLDLLADFATLDQIATPTHFNQAWQTLVKMAGKTVFQAKTPQAPIQVLGVLEAAALPFDFLWIAGMDDISWPPQPKPNPFIPKRLQRELNMPHATPDRELHYCQQLTEQFKNSATHVLFSSAKSNDELELHPSPLIRDLPEIYVDQLTLSEFIAPTTRIYQSRSMEILQDNQAPEIHAQEKVRGGISILKQQALCPFKAFAEWRLHAKELEETQSGLRAKDRGNIIHKILELVWLTLQHHAALTNMDNEELNTLISNNIDIALQSYPHGKHHQTRYLALEKERLQKLIWEWLQVEKSRAPFTVITHEKAASITLNKLQLDVRIDRIDSLSDGKKLIIDYKTGKYNDIHAWFSDRPEEPQLPVYALLDMSHTTAITFAQVFPGDHTFKGISHYSLDINGIKLLSEIKKSTVQSWPQQLEHWQSILLKLSDDFYNGVATVDPKNPPETCQYCQLKPLCRINEEPLNAI